MSNRFKPPTKAQLEKEAKSRKLTPRELTVMAAVFARSNMGMNLPEKKEVERLMQDRETLGRIIEPTLDTAVVAFCERFMESDEHYDMFMQEAKGWYKDLKKDRVGYLVRVHGDIAALFDLKA